MGLKKQDIMEALGIERETNWLPMALAGFGVGCVIGAGVAMLLAPKSGRELRSDIMGKGRDLIARGKEQIGHAQDAIKSPNQTF